MTRYSWTQACCENCWHARTGGGRPPVHLATPKVETCGFCGVRTASGIYVREDPAKVPYPRPRGRLMRCEKCNTRKATRLVTDRDDPSVFHAEDLRRWVLGPEVEFAVCASCDDGGWWSSTDLESGRVLYGADSPAGDVAVVR